MRTLLKLLQHNIWYKVIVSLKKWHYEKKFTYYCFFPPYTTFFSWDLLFLKRIHTESKQTKKNEEKKLLPRFHFFFLFSKKKQSSFNKNSRNIILKKSKKDKEEYLKKTRWIRWWKKESKWTRTEERGYL